MVSEKMQTHLQKVDAEGKFKDVKEIKEQETRTDSKLWQLALEIDVTATKEKTESKTDSFVKIDQLFSTLENTVEDKKQLALQYALNVIWLEIGEWEQSKIIWLKDIIVFFNKAVTQKEDGSWKLAMDLGKNGLTDDEKLIWAKFKDIIDNPTKHSALAYLIQRSAKEIINLEAAKWYWEESKRNEIAKVNADMYLWNQTRQALSALESWIDSDLSENSENADYLKGLTVDKIKNRGFIDASLKAKLESEEDNDIDSEVKKFWNEEVWEGKTYTRRYPHSTNFAIIKADWTVPEWDNSEQAEESVADENKEPNILDLETLYDCKIKVEDVEWWKKYTIKRGSENMNFVYLDNEKCFSFSTEWWNTSFSIAIEELSSNWENVKSPYDTALDKSVKIWSEVCRILTKVKNNHLDLDHFELSGDNKTLQADYCMKFDDSQSWNPILDANIFMEKKYDWVRDVDVLENIEETLGLDASTFCSYMNESFTDRKDKPAPVEVHKIDDNHFEVESHGQSITFLKRSSDTFVFKTKKWTELTIRWDQDEAQKCAAIINYIVSIIKNNWETLDYFEKDWNSLQADYEGRYFDVDLIADTKNTMWVDAQVLTDFMNSYRADVWI